MNSATLFSRNMKKLRQLHGYTLKQLAELIGVNLGACARWESKGEQFRFPSPENLDRIAEVYQIRVADLLSPDGAEQKSIRFSPSLQDAVIIVNNNWDKLQITPRAGLAKIKKT